MNKKCNCKKRQLINDHFPFNFTLAIDQPIIEFQPEPINQRNEPKTNNDPEDKPDFHDYDKYINPQKLNQLYSCA